VRVQPHILGINRESPLRKSSEIHRPMYSPRAAETHEIVHLKVNKATSVSVYTG
jgi:hypothetical protein